MKAVSLPNKVTFHSVPLEMISLTDDNLALNLLQNEASNVVQFEGLRAQHALKVLLSALVVVHTDIKELPDNVLHTVVLLDAAVVVEQNLNEANTSILQQPTTAS